MKINPLYRYGNPADWISAPVRFHRVGVHEHDDPQGPALYDLDVLRRSLPYWKLCPLTINHPSEYVHNRANPDDPDVVGAIEDVRLTGEFLSATAWLYKPRLAPELLQRIENGEQLHVSTGTTESWLHRSGEFRGERYDRVVLNIVPDHLAILPDGEGVIGLALNCGLNVAPLPKSGPKQSTAKKVMPNPLRSSRAVAARKLAAGLAKGEAFKRQYPF